MRLALVSLALLGAAVARPLGAQEPVTRDQVVAAALARGARAAFGRADTAAAAGVLHAARLYPNPSLSASYTKDTPRYHLLADLPLELPWLRAARIGAAAAGRDAARYGFAFERAAIRFDADTTYTHALAALAHARLSRRNAVDADSLLTVAQVRRDAGDVSELDVLLATVNAAQLENAAADDSGRALDAVLAVQLVMGLPGEEPTITLADSLVPPPDTVPAAPGEPLPLAAAAATLRSTERALALAHRSVFPAPSLQLGFDNSDPAEHGLLPVVGLSFALPIFNWNGGEVAQAAAARDRAQANVTLVRRETSSALARARRTFALARARLGRDRVLLASANRVAAMSLEAYVEGASALATVLEAERSAREALGHYIDDLAAAADAAAASRLLAAGDEP